MATPQVPILKKEYLNMIPEFNGEKELLPRFLDLSEKLVNKFYNTINIEDFQNEYLMANILAKIKGEAAINISSCVIKTWLDLKNALLNTYADKRDIYTLILEISDLKQNFNETVFDFYHRILKSLNLQISYISTHSLAQESIVLIPFVRNYALRILLRGLKEPIGQLMRTKNPPDLNTALSMLTNDFQFETNSKFIKTQTNKSNYKQTQPRIYEQKPNPQFRFAQNTQYPFNKNKIMPSQNQSWNKPYNKPSHNNQGFKPTPMSVSTRNTFQPRPGPSHANHNSSQFRPNNQFKPKQNYISEELFNINDEENEVTIKNEPNYENNYEFDIENYGANEQIPFLEDPASNHNPYQNSN